MAFYGNKRLHHHTCYRFDLWWPWPLTFFEPKSSSPAWSWLARDVDFSPAAVTVTKTWYTGRINTPRCIGRTLTIICFSTRVHVHTDYRYVDGRLTEHCDWVMSYECLFGVVWYSHVNEATRAFTRYRTSRLLSTTSLTNGSVFYSADLAYYYCVDAGCISVKYSLYLYSTVLLLPRVHCGPQDLWLECISWAKAIKGP